MSVIYYQGEILDDVNMKIPARELIGDDPEDFLTLLYTIIKPVKGYGETHASGVVKKVKNDSPLLSLSGGVLWIKGAGMWIRIASEDGAMTLKIGEPAA